MTTRDHQPHPDSDHDHQTGAAVSPAIGPLPAIYVAQPLRRAGTIAARRNRTARAARQARGWAAHRISHLGA